MSAFTGLYGLTSSLSCYLGPVRYTEIFNGEQQQQQQEQQQQQQYQNVGGVGERGAVYPQQIGESLVPGYAPPTQGGQLYRGGEDALYRGGEDALYHGEVEQGGDVYSPPPPATQPPPPPQGAPEQPTGYPGSG